MVSRQVTAVAPTSKRHYTNDYIIVWLWDLRRGQDGSGPRTDIHTAKAKTTYCWM